MDEFKGIRDEIDLTSPIHDWNEVRIIYYKFGRIYNLVRENVQYKISDQLIGYPYG